MGNTNFRPFASTDNGSNLLTDSEYSTLRQLGHQPGIASSKLANKEARQASLMATAIAEFIAVNVDDDVLDSMTPEQIGALFQEAIGEIGAGVGNATTTARGIVELADNDETIGGSDAERAVTPAGLAARTATQTRRGLAQFATSAQAQAAAGSASTSLAVTPKALAERTATEGRTGIAQLATVAEAEAGTDTAKVVTPAGMAAGLAAQFAGDLSTPGYVTFPGGFVVQWGFFNTTGNPPQTFPLEFPTACFGVQGMPDGGADLSLTAMSAAGFTITTGGSGQVVRWFAYGH